MVTTKGPIARGIAALPFLAVVALAGPLQPTRASQLVTARTGPLNVQCPFGGGGPNVP
jgi:hypothetical protein